MFKTINPWVGYIRKRNVMPEDIRDSLITTAELIVYVPKRNFHDI